jgi:hypothetical protein
MNTKNKQNQTNQRQKTRQEQGSKKQGQNHKILHDDLKLQNHEHEHPETRLTR